MNLFDAKWMDFTRSARNDVWFSFPSRNHLLVNRTAPFIFGKPQLPRVTRAYGAHNWCCCLLVVGCPRIRLPTKLLLYRKRPHNQITCGLWLRTFGHRVPRLFIYLLLLVSLLYSYLCTPSVFIYMPYYFCFAAIVFNKYLTNRFVLNYTS